MKYKFSSLNNCDILVKCVMISVICIYVKDLNNYPERTWIISMKSEKNKTDGREPREERKNTMLQEIISWVQVLVTAIVLAWLITSFIIVNATVPSGSMENTIQPGDRLFGLRLTYLFSKPERGDIIVFKYPVNEALIKKLSSVDGGKEFLKKNDIHHVNYIKRLIGLPGETVTIEDGCVYIDGELLDEPYLKETWVEKNDGFTFEVPEGCYLMMGDNRNNSSDARYWKNISLRYFEAAGVTLSDEEAESLQYVKKSQILGKAYLRYWPLTKISSLY